MLATLAVLLLSCLAPAHAGATDPATPSDDEIVVTAIRNIVVNGRARRCRAAAGDPLDDVDVGLGTPSRAFMAIVPDGRGSYALMPNSEQLTGPDFWQRVGVGMDGYVFRVASTDAPMCVGRGVGVAGFAGFRRIVDAAAYRGHRLRFTAWVASGRAQQVNFWLAAGTAWRSAPRRSGAAPRRLGSTAFNRLLNGGNTNGIPFRGDNGWTPVLLETGPIHPDAHHISYGFNLQGSGDVWVYRPRLEIVLDQGEERRTGDRIVIGRDRPRRDPESP